MYSAAGKLTKTYTPMQKKYRVIKAIFSKCLCSLTVQFLKANKYNPAIIGQSKLLETKTNPSNTMILKETLINTIRQVTMLAAKYKKRDDCWEDND